VVLAHLQNIQYLKRIVKIRKNKELIIFKQVDKEIMDLHTKLEENILRQEF
jgi:hypothetical protein